MRTVLLLLLFASAIEVLCEEFSEQGKLNLLNAHNEYRSRLAQGQLVVRGVKKPSASRMRKMSWSDKIATAARLFAETCPKNHSDIKQLAAQRFQIGHAIQMAWQDTSKVGCGYSKCSVGAPDQTLVVVCRYFQKGNIEGLPIYDEGKTCSKCPKHYQKCPFGLCEKEGINTD
ncbi:Protein CBR-TAG-254 [Caenorhabditis briggsae]|uniref:Protein CBR-TAG-254 n=1 Tax=Caenorhabditis briggsae TaxID=6238 RepID=A8WJR5_CAEBR|nr:Protein CBR-TAG-254 [Caenorhabditis briggsae]CAP20708.2 Protein CBR-TAG-254 [Caenorhabditis briggsae]